MWTVRDHGARVTCLRFSEHYKYLYTCDEDGLILHYQRLCHEGDFADKDCKAIIDRQSKRNALFPFHLVASVHDQLMEILAIDTNETLDMYATLSRDGTISVRCQRTSRLWQHFHIFAKTEGVADLKKRLTIDKFNKIFKRVHFLKLSLHGYIVVCGEGVKGSTISSQYKFLYLVFSLNGDLLRQKPEQRSVRIKNIFLNSREDMLIVASNSTKEG